MGAEERRRHPRYRSKVDAFAVLGADAQVLAQLIDISEGGMSVWYVDGNGAVLDTGKVDLFLMNSPYRITGLPVETLSDFESAHMEVPTDRTIRRRCFRFGHLLNVQKDAVTEFITYHTETTAP
jgi:hypothetical protein